MRGLCGGASEGAGSTRHTGTCRVGRCSWPWERQGRRQSREEGWEGRAQGPSGTTLGMPWEGRAGTLWHGSGRQSRDPLARPWECPGNAEHRDPLARPQRGQPAGSGAAAAPGPWCCPCPRHALKHRGSCASCEHPKPGVQSPARFPRSSRGRGGCGPARPGRGSAGRGLGPSRSRRSRSRGQVRR